MGLNIFSVANQFPHQLLNHFITLARKSIDNTENFQSIIVICATSLSSHSFINLSIIRLVNLLDKELKEFDSKQVFACKIKKLLLDLIIYAAIHY
jgi:hypothetical protein